MTDAHALPRPRPTLAALPVVARVFSWPLAALLLLAGTLWRTVALVARGFSLDARDRHRGYVAAAARYLAFRSDAVPPFSGRGVDAGSRGPWNEAKHRLKKSRVAMLSWIGIALYLYVGVAAQAGWTGDFQVQDRDHSYAKPDAFGAWNHPLGADLLGRDVLRVALRGTSTALWIGFFAALLSSAIGAVLGALAGYFGRWVDVAIVWLYTTVESVPYILLILAFGYVFKANTDLQQWYAESFLRTGLGVSMGLFVIVLAVGLTSWVGVCRTVRGEFLRLRERDYVTAARAIGVSTRRTIFRHVFPNAFHLVLVSYSLLFVNAIKFEAILTFLGIGVDEGEASWGQMIAQARVELIRYPDPVWWQLTTATVFMFGLVLCVNLFADALRDALDPRLRD